MDSLRRALKRKVEEEIYEWPPGENRYFIARSTTKELVNEPSITNILKQEFAHKSEQNIRQVASEIFSSSKRLFTIFLLMPDIRLSIIEELLEEGVRDVHLPLSRVETMEHAAGGKRTYELAKAEHNECRNTNHRDCFIKSLSSLDKSDIKIFDERQWQTLAPKFQLSSNAAPHYEFPRATILPYTEDFEAMMSKSGGFGEVWRVRIHPAHHDLEDYSHAEGHLLAIKRLISNSDYEKTFNLEVEMLRSLNAHRHRHIVKLLATYRLKGRYHMIFPLASGNLRDYWLTGDKPIRNRSIYCWVMTQLVGLVSALELIHRETGRAPVEPDVPNPGTSSRPLFRSIRLRVESTEAKFGRHGDIKPENILWMRDSSDASETLLIADMGLGRYHRKESKSLVDPRTVNGSHTYAPPEVELNLPVSRAYDIWSLGCVFLEFTTWLLQGPQGLTKFGSMRTEMAEDGIDDDTFYSIRTSGSKKHAEVRPGVTSWIKKLKEDDHCSKLLEELLEVIENQMLCVDPGCRTMARDLNLSLESMMSETSTDVTDLLWSTHI